MGKHFARERQICPETTISIDRAKPRDFLAIARLDRIAWTQGAHAEFIPDGEHVWRIWVEHALVYCAKLADEEVVGAVLVFPTRKASYCLHKAFVAEAYRGKGIGTKLIDAVLSEVDELCGDCFLTVDPSNEVALRLYASWGFTEREFIPGFYRDQEDRFVLTRRTRRGRGVK